MRKALLLSALFILGTTTLASAHYNGCPHRHYPNGAYVSLDPYCVPRRHVDPRYEYGPPRQYYDDRDYYEDRRPGFGIDIPGGPSIRIRP